MRTPSESLAKELVKRLLIYRELQAEREEILRHKWYESQKVGYDIGMELATIDWQLKHRSEWRRARKYGHADFGI